MLLKNNFGKGFIDESSKLKLNLNSETLNATWHSTWSDIDNDGDLDLFLSQWADPGITGEELGEKKPQNSALLINQDGYFVDASQKLQISDVINGKNFVSAAFGDFNRDGFQDLFLSSFSRGQSKLLLNDSGKKFHLTSTSITDPGFTTSFIDIDHDGQSEIFQSGNAQLAHVIDGVNNTLKTTALNKIWKADNINSLQAIPSYFLEACGITTLGAAIGDVNNDGCYDFYFATGNPEQDFNLPNLFYLGVEKSGLCSLESSLPVSPSEVFADYAKTQGVVFFDFDNDGDQDLLMANSGLWEGQEGKLKFFKNELENKGSWLGIRLHSAGKNTFAVGAEVIIEFINRDGARLQRRALINNKTGFGSAPYLAFVAFGDDLKKIERLIVRWPDALTKTYQIPKLNSYIEINEQI